jgi:large repetitive protein
MTRTVLVAAALVTASAWANPLSPIDAFHQSPRRVPLRVPSPAQLGSVASVEPRLGVPTFVWATRAEPAVRSLRDQGVEPASAAQRALVQFGALYGLTPDRLADASLVRLHDLGSGAIVASFEKRVGTVPVFRDRLHVVMNQRLEVIALSGYLTPNQPTGAEFNLTDETAFRLALEEAVGGPVDSSQVVAGALDEASMRLFSVSPEVAHVGAVARAKRVYFNVPEGLVPAWYVELEAGPKQATSVDLQAWVISAVDGRVLFRHSLTMADSYTYRVWAETTAPFFPLEGPQGNGATPHPAGTPNFLTLPFVPSSLLTLQNAPFSRNDPWLPPGATETTGNNVEAYADLAPPDGFGAGDVRGVATATRTFDTTYDLALNAGATAGQRQAGITQLFFDINWLHDWFYDHGFTEKDGNAQTNNFSRGGAGNDSIRGEAQDGSGTNNANMAVPSDGARPRMQMYVWHLPTSASFTRGTTTSAAGYANFGAATFSLTAAAALINDGSAPVTDGCSAIVNATAVAGKIAVIDRGGCEFAAKAKFAQNAGAIGAVMVNDMPGAPNFMTGIDASVTIPIVSVTDLDGAALKAALAAGAVTVTITHPPIVDRDGEIDNTVVAHEWGHYLSGRLIADGAGLTENQAGGMGEGWSDFVAMLMLVQASDATVPSNPNYSGTYAITTYAFGTPGFNNAFYFGIRRYPYSTDFTRNALTFKHIQDAALLPDGVPVAENGLPNSEVHATGEVWTSMLWECYAGLLRATGRLTFTQARDRMQSYLVASLKATPPNPTFTEARDALLSVAAANDPLDALAFATAFAKRGLGLNAVAPDRASIDNTPVVEDFSLSNELVLVSAKLDDSTFYCDHDGVLDVGETGRLLLTFRNVGFASLSASTATVTTTTPNVTITPSPISLPTSAPFSLVTASIEVTVAGLTTPGQLDLNVAWADPQLPPKLTPRTASLSFRVNTDSVPATSAADDAEAAPLAWGVAHAPSLSGRFDWSQRELSPMQHVLFGPDASAPADLTLTSPPLVVSTTAPLVITLVHRWAFETTQSINYDGAVIELSTNAGATWTDLGAAAGYNGTVGQSAMIPSPNPLLNRAAYVNHSLGYPNFITTSIRLGTTYAGQTVQLRLRTGSDFDGADVGWEIDSIAFSGITNTPFPSLVADRAQCVNRPPIANAGPDQTVMIGATVRLDSSASSDPDHDPITARWTQKSGPTVSLSSASFVAPTVNLDTDLVFELIVSDGQLDSAPDTVTVTVQSVNRLPLVDAGTPLTVDERSTVTVVGSALDPGRRPLTYQWSQADGIPVTLVDATSPTLTFTAPDVTPAQVTAGTNRARLTLTASDGLGAGSATVTITIRDVNRAPTVSARASAVGPTTVALTGTAVDLDGDPLTVHWQQTGGASVSLQGGDSANATFAAPADVNQTMSFDFTASDGVLSAVAHVTFKVNELNSAPTAHAGLARSVKAGERVSLDGSASTDPDGDTLTASWTLDSGPAAAITSADRLQASFVAPEVTASTDLVFRLTVSDPAGATSTDTVTLTVLPGAGCGCHATPGLDQVLLLAGLAWLARRRQAR